MKRLYRRLERRKTVLKQLEDKYNGNERFYTFYGGRELGYAQAEVSHLEERIEELEESDG